MSADSLATNIVHPMYMLALPTGTHALRFANAAERLTLEHYKGFEQLCTPAEWQAFEPRLLSCLEAVWTDAKVNIWLHREESLAKRWQHAYRTSAALVLGLTGSVQTCARKP